VLQHKSIANLFYENSTRLRAAVSSGRAQTRSLRPHLDIKQLLVTKGESISDTARTLVSMAFTP